jgi:hypothetical protein
MTALICLLAMSAPADEVTAGENLEHRCCGRYALSLVGGFVDEDKSGIAWEATLPAAHAPFSMARLESAAKAAGLDAVSVRWPDPAVADLTLPCVLHVKASEQTPEPDHFVACFGSVGDHVLIGEYPARPRFLRRSEVLRLWSGAALYVGRPGAGDLDQLRWQARMVAARPLLWAAAAGGVGTFVWLTSRQKRASRPAEVILAAKEAPQE